MYRDLLSCYVCEAYWRQKELKDVDPKSQVTFLPLTSMYMGATLLKTLEYMQQPVDVQYFLQKVQELYAEAASQIKKKISHWLPHVRDA